MMGTEWVVVQHVPSDYQVSIDSFIGIFTLLLNRYLAVYQLNTFAIYLGNRKMGSSQTPEKEFVSEEG